MKVELNKIRKYIGFTLAELLIVIGVVGIVAEMTIPVILNNVQKQVYVTTLKKTYLNFNQVLTQLVADYGCYGDLKCTGLFKSTSTASAIGSEIIKYYKVIKNCDTAANQGCMSSAVNANFDGSGSTTNYDSGSWGANGPYYRFITIDGVSVDIVFDNSVDNCGQNKSSGSTGNLEETCTWVRFDVNGPTTGPNYYGRDVYIFWISNGNGPLLYPQGGRDDANVGWWKSGAGGCGNNNNGGYKCAARIMEEGWQMNY